MKLLTVIGLSAILTAACSGGNDSGAQGEPTGSPATTGSAGSSTGAGPTTGSGGATDTTGASTTSAASSTTTGAGGSAGSTTGAGGTGGSGGAGGGDDAGSANPPDAGTTPDAGGSPDAGPISGPGPAGMSSFDWGKAVVDTEIAGKTALGTSYPEGLILHGIYKAYKRLKDPRYLAILTASADSYGVAGGGSLDSVMHMTALVDAYELTMKASYKAPADGTRRIFDNYPKSTDGVFWHGTGASRAHQLWGDGVFMSMSFLSRYGTVFDDPTTYAIGVTQVGVTGDHLRNPATGLLWHAYDESGMASWVKLPSKTNEIHWGRAMGWWGMASVMVLEEIPANDPGRPKIEKGLADLVTALAKYQDPATGRWFQVVDQGTDPRNWTETSASSMYSYVTWWAYQHKLVDASFAAVATKGFNGVLKQVTKDAQNKTTIAEVCTGLNASGNVADYYSHPRASNDPHGIGSFILMWEGMQ
jgi:unsaturated rhamnogalacturonyl hydrolase